MKREDILKVQGHKDDVGKERYDLIPHGPLREFAKLWTMGARKYADHNWRKGILYSRLFSAMMRHAWAFWGGESFDPDGQHHLDSVAWCAFVLREFEMNPTEYLHFDDR